MCQDTPLADELSAKKAEKAVGQQRDDYDQQAGQRRRWDPFHSAINFKLEKAVGTFDIKNIEEVGEADLRLRTNRTKAREEAEEAAADKKKNASATVTLMMSSGPRRTQSMVIDEDERGGGGKERQRDKVRKFKYKTRDGGGDLYVKVLFTGDKLDMRGNDEKEDDMGKRRDMEREFGVIGGADSALMDMLGAGFDAASTDFDPRMAAALGKLSGPSQGGGSGLILDIPTGLSDKLGGGSSTKGPRMSYPHSMFYGEMESHKAIKATKTLLVPSPVCVGDLLDAEYVVQQRRLYGRDVELAGGGFAVAEWIDLRNRLDSSLTGTVGEMLATMHTEGQLQECGFPCETFFRGRPYKNSPKKDLVEFFLETRLEPEIAAACKKMDTKTGRKSELSRREREEIGSLGNLLLDRIADSYVWRQMIFAPSKEEPRSLLHGDLWLGNIAANGQNGKPVALGASSWYGPPEFDLTVAATFGMPSRFFEAYNYHTPPIEGCDIRMKVYRLFILLNHINQLDPKKPSSHRAYKFQGDNDDLRASPFKGGSVSNPGKHKYWDEMKMFAVGTSGSASSYAKEVLDLMEELLSLEDGGTPKKIIKLWSKPMSK